MFLPFFKYAGGPGSGVQYHNTDLIDDMEHSPFVTIGKRQKVLDTEPSEKDVSIKISDITHVGQKSYVVKKLASLLSDPKGDWLEKPIKVFKHGDHYHVMDGHHRFLAAKRLGYKTLKADVWTELPDEFYEKEAAANELVEKARKKSKALMMATGKKVNTVWQNKKTDIASAPKKYVHHLKGEVMGTYEDIKHPEQRKSLLNDLRATAAKSPWERATGRKIAGS